MSITLNSTSTAARETRSPAGARSILLLAIVGAAAVGFLAGNGAETPEAVGAAGAELTRLLRAMAALKALMAMGLAAGVFWRLQSPVGPGWLAAYAAACGAMAAGPGLIWGMAHVGAGAALLHAGLLAGLVLLWRDNVVGQRLAAAIATRRSALRAR